MADQRRIEDLKRRVQQDPASIAFAALAEEYRRSGLFHEAVETCRAGLLRHPVYLSARVTLGRALLELGQLDEAQTELEQVIRAAPENLAAIRALADIHRRRGDTPEPIIAAPEKPVATPAPVVPLKPVATTDKPAAAEKPIALKKGSGETPPLVEAKGSADRVISASAPPTVVKLPVVQPHPALPRLEGLLAAILRARHELESRSNLTR
jgi:tetratricopeptide (TPR) repeat protein